MSGGQRRVAVTGCGVVTPVGHTVDEMWASLLAGRSGIGPIVGWDAADLPVRFAAEVVGFPSEQYLDYKVRRRIDASAVYGVAAAIQAVRESGLEIDGATAPRTGVYIGSSVGPSQMTWDATFALEKKGPRGVSPYYFATSGSESAAGEVSLMFGACGPSASLSTACASGATCIGEASRLVASGVVDVMIAGGTESPVNRIDIAAAAACKALSTRNDDPAAACRPFDRARDGFVMGAGAGIVVLEELERARRRGAPIMAELAGYGATTDAYHLTAPDPDGTGTKRAMTMALDAAQAVASDVDYVNAHGTSTVMNDRTEAASLRGVLGERATRVPISSTKAMTGHSISGSGAIELIVCVQAIGRGAIPPTLNCDDPLDPDLDFVPGAARDHDVDVAMSNSFGFGGHNAVLVTRRYRGDAP